MAGSCGCPGREDTSPRVNIHTALVFGCRTRKGRGSRGALTVEELPSSSTSLRTRFRRARNEAGCRGR